MFLKITLLCLFSISILYWVYCTKQYLIGYFIAKLKRRCVWAIAFYMSLILGDVLFIYSIILNEPSVEFLGASMNMLILKTTVISEFNYKKEKEIFYE